MNEVKTSHWLKEYVGILENLNADNLDSLESVLAQSVYFKDPFNEVKTRAAFISIMQDMFSRLSKVRFVVHQMIEKDNDAFLQWTFYGNSSITGPFDFQGTSVLKVDEHKKIILHHDYWDGSVLMQKIPFIGRVISGLRSKMGH
jgi:hypothetical protein